MNKARFGGLGISDPVESASLAFLSSRKGASVLVDTIRGAGAVAFRVTTHLDQLARVRHDVSERRMLMHCHMFHAPLLMS